MAEGNYDVVIVGGGPGGLTAALVLGRTRRRVLLIDDGTYRNLEVDEFHGFPGRDGTSPARFRDDIATELSRYDVEITGGTVSSAAEGDSTILLQLPERAVEGRRVVLATGVHDELPSTPGLAERWGKSAVTCPFCDGWEIRDRPVAVIATSDGAEHLATVLRNWTSQVTVVPVERARRLVGVGTSLEAIELVDGTTVRADAVFVRTTMRPRASLAEALSCKLEDSGFIVTSDTGATSNPLVWAVGDVRRPPPHPHQVLLAAADGTAAAIDIHRSWAGL